MPEASPPQTTVADPEPPVLVLGSHRSGTSAVTGLLAEAGGLLLGDVLPPTSANAKGYFESAVIVRGHNRVLEDLDRDWTCPPAALTPDPEAAAGIAAEVRLLQSTGRPWGVKDPRLLFLLPLWAKLVPAVRFVGVIRDHEETVRSLVERDGLDAGVADAITRAHVRRLRVLAERFDVPVIDFSSGTDAVLGRVRDVARGLGLQWDEPAAARFFDASLAKSRGRGAGARNEDIDRLREGPSQQTEAELVSCDRLEEVLGDLARLPDELDRYVGPRSAARRRRVWRRVPSDARPAVELVRTLDVAASVDPVPSGAEAVAGRDLMSLHALVGRERLLLAGLALPDVTSWLPRQELRPALRLVRECVRDGAIVAIGLSRADVDTKRRLGQEPITVAVLREAASSCDFAVLSEEHEPNLDIVRLVALRSTVTVLAELLHGSTTAALAGPPTSVAADDVRPEAGGRTAAQQRQDAAYWQQRYERLRGRRSVRLVLRVAELTRPLFRLVRRFRDG